MDRVYLETQRFIIRQWIPEDAAVLWMIMANPKVHQYTALNPYLPKQPELEWQFGTQYWGKGYATEIGKAVIEAAFASTDVERIFGMVNPLNKASMRVMEKIGMSCLGLQDFRGEQDLFYQIERSVVETPI